MEQLKSNFLNMALVLTIISLVAAGALAAVYTLTVEPIAQAKAQKEEQAVRDVLPPYTRTETDSVNGLALVRAYNGDTFVGAAVKTEETGFGGAVKLMVGFDAQGKIVNYSILEQTETPGLGTKMVDWFKTDKNHQNICGLNPSEVNFTVSKDGGDIDAITAATISSRAFLNAVRKAYNAYADNPQADGISGASAQQHNEIATDSVATIADEQPEIEPVEPAAPVAESVATPAPVEPTAKPAPAAKKSAPVAKPTPETEAVAVDTQTIVEPENKDTL